MYVEASGIAQFKINATDEVVNVAAEDLDWDCEGEGERGMGPELVHSAEADVSGHTIRWSIWEYPIGVENNSETYVPPALTRLSDISFSLAYEPEDD